MRTYQLTITGTQPLLMHSDDIEWSDRMEAWKNDKDNKKVSKAGDDRSPAFRWLGCLYHGGDPDQIVMPTANIMRALMEGGASVLTGKGQKTFKAQSQSGIMPRSHAWPLLVNGKTIPWGPLSNLINEKDFQVHKDFVKEFGFELFIKRARIGQSKHVRVRPIFFSWQTMGELVVSDDQITTSVLQDIADVAGQYKGLGDWRPSSKTPGNYGMFSAELKQLT